MIDITNMTDAELNALLDAAIAEREARKPKRTPRTTLTPDQIDTVEWNDPDREIAAVRLVRIGPGPREERNLDMDMDMFWHLLRTQQAEAGVDRLFHVEIDGELFKPESVVWNVVSKVDGKLTTSWAKLRCGRDDRYRLDPCNGTPLAYEPQ